MKPAGYRHRPRGLAGALRRCGEWVARATGRTRDSDYFSQVAEMPGVPDHARARAVAIVLHQRRLTALYRLLAVDEVAAAASRASPRSTARG
jgi:hypothetical protein